MEKKDMKVFMVEDNEFFARVVSEALEEQFGYHIDLFYTGEDMLKCIHKKPDVILLDFQLNSANIQSMNGDKVLAEIKKASPATKVVMISSQDDLEQAIGLLKHGACNYICKDIHSVNNIDNTLQHLLELAQLTQEVTTYRNKSQRERNRLLWLMSIVGTGLMLSYYFG